MSARDSYVREEAVARGLFREVPIEELDPRKGDVVIGVCLRDISNASLHLGAENTYEDRCEILNSAGLLPIGWAFVPYQSLVAKGDMLWGRGIGPWENTWPRWEDDIASCHPVIRKV